MLGPTHMVQKLLTDEDHSWIAANEGAESTDVMKLGYDDFSRRTILRAILPPELDVASSFEEAGHIAHYNLKQEYLPYKEIIGTLLFMSRTLPGLPILTTRPTSFCPYNFLCLEIVRKCGKSFSRIS